MRCFVSGCAGFIASLLTEALLEDGHEVVGVDCFNNNYGRREKLRNLERARDWDRFDFVPIDLARGELSDVVEDCDVIFHLAAEPGVRRSWGGRFESYVRNNVVATQHLLEAACARPERRIVYASSSSIYGQAARRPTAEDVIPAPYSPYGVTKLGGEHLCTAYHANLGLNVVTLRYFSVYGPRQRPDMAFNRFMRAALEDRAIELYGGEQTRDFTFVGDVVKATRLAATANGVAGLAINIGGGSSVSLRQTLDLISEISGRHLDIREAPSQRGDVTDTAADVTRARELLGFKPETGLEEGLEAEWEWLTAMLAR